MKRFNYDENEDFQDDNPLFHETGDEDISPEEYAEMMERREAIELMQIELASLDLRQRLLFKTVKLLEKSFWWKFKSASNKLIEISKMYHRLKVTIDPPRKE
jgi:hypothetical protein